MPTSYSLFSAKLTLFLLLVFLYAACTIDSQSNNTTSESSSETNTDSTPEPDVDKKSSDLISYYTRMDSGEDWEKHQFVMDYPDIIVKFSESERFYFWRASSYLPRWQTSAGSNYVAQIFNTQGDGQGLRWDKLNRHSHVRIIKQSKTEAVIHWRYAPVFDTDINPMMPNWTGWVDEYYTVRNDYTVTREIIHHDEQKKKTILLSLESDGRINIVSSSEAAYTPTPPEFNSTNELPTGPDLNFGARYTKLGYSGNWDTGPIDGYEPNNNNWNNNWQVHDHPDVVVNFDDNKTKWVFWRGLGFVPSMVSENGAWFSNEFNESWGWPEMCEDGGAEPMNDKQARYSHVRIIENSPARVVVHWRYHPTGICYNLIDTNNTPDDWGATSEFYFYIYPDGSTLSKNVLHSQQVNTYGDEPNGFEYHEAIIINSAGVDPWDNIELEESVTTLNMFDDEHRYDGKNGGINNIGDEPFDEPDDPNITRINLKNTNFDTYTIMEHGDTLEIMPYWKMDFATEYPNHHFVRWDHWPVNHIRAFGRGADNAQYPSHTSLFHMAFNPPYAQTETSQTRLLLTGLSDMDNSDIVQLAKSWLQAPSIVSVNGSDQYGYDQSQRAYYFDISAPSFSFTLNASSANPVFNPAFILNNWNKDTIADIKVNGMTRSDVKSGIVYDTSGKQNLLLFLPFKSTSPTTIEVCDKKC